jgi:hypothetical protein
MNEDELIAHAQGWRMQIEYYKGCLRNYDFYNLNDQQFNAYIYSALEHAIYNFNQCMSVLVQVVSPEILNAAKNLVKLRLGIP